MTSLIYVAIVTSRCVNDVVWEARQCDVIFKLTLSDVGCGCWQQHGAENYLVSSHSYILLKKRGGGQANYDPPYNGSMSFPLDRLF